MINVPFITCTSISFQINVTRDQEMMKHLVFHNCFNDQLRSTYKCSSKAYNVK